MTESRIGMSREIARLVATIEQLDLGCPAYDVSVSDADLAVDAWAYKVAALDPGTWPNLAKELLPRMPGGFGRYATRAAARAWAAQEPDLSRAALAVTVMLYSFEDDWRDVMISLGPHHYVEAKLHGSPVESFNWAADLAEPVVAETVRKFGRRTNVGLFGWKLVNNDEVPWFVWS